MQTALTRGVSRTIDQCALSFIDREAIDLERARVQHRVYEETLERLGVRVVSLPPEDDLHDAVFVEDTAVVVDELAVMTAPRLEARRREVSSVAEALARYRPLWFLEGGASLEGGDVMRIRRTLYAGRSARSNAEGIEQLRTALEPHGYGVRAAEFAGCLHLKSACSYLGRNTVLVNPDWVDGGQFGDVNVIEVAASEPAAANVLAVSDVLVMPACYPETRKVLERAGFTVIALDVSELQKAEAGVTCCSLIFET
jgi:dimethylargininase